MSLVECETCDGKGVVRSSNEWMSGGEDADCPTCDGSGKIEADEDVDAADREIDRLDMLGLDPWGRVQ